MFSILSRIEKKFPIKKVSKVSSVVLFLFLCCFFIWRGSTALDPDFGWHFKSGEYILQNGFSSNDPFSYTMPSFPFIDHAWGSSVLFFILYPLIGHVGLAILAFIFVFGALLFVSRIGLSRKDQSISGLVGQVVFSPVFIISVGVYSCLFLVRAQVFSWFFWSIFLYIFLQKDIWQKYNFFLPLLFLFWVNMHGGFAIGIFSLGIFALIRLCKRNITMSDLGIIFVSLLVTVINPYGIHIWKEVFMTISSPLLRTDIAEWRSIIFSPDLPLFCFMTLSGIFIFKYWKRFELEYMFLYVFLFTQSILSLKNVPFFILMAIPLTIRSFSFLKDEVNKIPHGKERFQKLSFALWFVFLIFLLYEFIFSMKVAYALREEVYYPQKAVEYLKENKPKGQVFSNYGWGGYLNWKYPEKKVFIDGRMAIWRWNGSPPGELPNAFETYIKIGKGEIDYKEAFETFDIDTVLLPHETDIKPNNTQLGKWEDYLKNVFGIKDDFNFIRKLEEDGWEKVYEDKTAVIYVKNTGTN